MQQRIFFVLIIVIICTQHSNAQNGLFLRLSVGPGIMNEYSANIGTGLTLVTKNHAIGWGFNDSYALYVNEFGGLIKKGVDEYNYINLDAYGLGFSYGTPANIIFSLSGGYGMVSFAHKWSEPEGDLRGEGYAVRLGLEKKWIVSKRWNLGLGPQIIFLKTTNDNYEFINVSLNFFLEFHLT